MYHDHVICRSLTNRNCPHHSLTYLDVISMGKPPSTNVSLQDDRTHDRYVMTDTGINTHLVYRLVSPSHRLPGQKLNQQLHR